MAQEIRAKEPVDIGSRRELFLDDLLIDRLDKLERQLHHPVPQNVAITHDAAWEGTGSGYHCVFRDGQRYRMYYHGAELKLTGNHEAPVLCLAESEDGIRWSKPNLGLHEFKGSRENNIVMVSGPQHGIDLPIDASHVTVALDENPAAASEARYKAFAADKKGKGLYALGSPDGLKWHPLKAEMILTSGQYDSLNTFCWDPQAKIYRAYCRSWDAGEYRGIRTATSADFLTWSEFQPIEFEPAVAPQQLYTNGVRPYFRAPHLLVGLPTRYIERGWSDSMRALPDLRDREERAKNNLRYGTALTDVLLMSSRDGRKFHRFDETFLRPGPERPGTWNYGQQYVAWQMVETKSPLDDQVPELSFYSTERYWHGPGTVLRRYSLRLDGFVSLHAAWQEGELVTRPFRFAGTRLELNFATSAAGGLRVEIQDPSGKPIPGYTLADCPELFGDALARTVSWKSSSDLAGLAGKPIRLRFVVRDADLFAIRFDSVN